MKNLIIALMGITSTLIFASNDWFYGDADTIEGAYQHITQPLRRNYDGLNPFMYEIEIHCDKHNLTIKNEKDDTKVTIKRGPKYNDHKKDEFITEITPDRLDSTYTLIDGTQVGIKIYIEEGRYFHTMKYYKTGHEKTNEIDKIQFIEKMLVVRDQLKTMYDACNDKNEFLYKTVDYQEGKL